MFSGQILTGWQWRWWWWWCGDELSTRIEMAEERYYWASYGHSMGHQEYYNINLFIGGFVFVINFITIVIHMIIIRIMMMAMMIMMVMMMMMMMMISWCSGRGCIHPSRGFPCQQCCLCIFISLSIGSSASSSSSSSSQSSFSSLSPSSQSSFSSSSASSYHNSVIIQLWYLSTAWIFTYLAPV